MANSSSLFCLVKGAAKQSVPSPSLPVRVDAAYPRAGRATTRVTVRTVQTRLTVVRQQAKRLRCSQPHFTLLIFFFFFKRKKNQGNVGFIFLPFSFQRNFARPLSLSAPTTAASPSTGCVTAPTTAATTAMRTTSAVSETKNKKNAL